MYLKEQELRQIDSLDWERKEAEYKKNIEELKLKFYEAAAENSKLRLELQRMNLKESTNSLSKILPRKKKFFDELRKAYNITQDVFGFDPDTGEIILDEVENE